MDQKDAPSSSVERNEGGPVASIKYYFQLFITRSFALGYALRNPPRTALLRVRSMIRINNNWKIE